MGFALQCSPYFVSEYFAKELIRSKVVSELYITLDLWIDRYANRFAPRINCLFVQNFSLELQYDTFKSLYLFWPRTLYIKSLIYSQSYVQYIVFIKLILIKKLMRLIQVEILYCKFKGIQNARQCSDCK